MKRTAIVLCLLGLVNTMGSRSQAGVITYTETETASGTLGASAFSNALVTVMVTGDTANVTGGSGFFTNTVGTFTVTVAGVGTATFTDQMEVFVNQGSIAAGFGDTTVGGSVLDTFDTAFATYGLTTAIGPITNASYIRPDLTFATTLGGFNISSDLGVSTFTAGAVPEPGSLILMGIGGVAAATLRARRVISKRRTA